MRDAIVFAFCILQSIQTGTFLTLDVVTNSLRNAWGFSNAEIIQVGTIGYSLGFATMALFCLTLLDKFSITALAVCGNVITATAWILIRLLLCSRCIPWWGASILEGSIAFGTAVGYVAAIQIVQKTPVKHRKAKIIILAISVSIGSVLSFGIFKLLHNVSTTIIIMLCFTIISGVSLVIATKIDIEEDEILYPVLDPPTKGPKFTWNYAVFIIGIIINFGIIVTFFNNASNMIIISGKFTWDPEIPLVCLVLGNLAGRSIGFGFKNILSYTPWLYAFMSLVSAGLQITLLTYWCLQIVIAILVINSVFFGLIWGLAIPLTKEFFDIAEDRALGNCSLGMAIGPLIFGPFASWIYSLHQFENGCDYWCFKPYLIFSVVTSFIAIVAYIASWILVNRRNNML